MMRVLVSMRIAICLGMLLSSLLFLHPGTIHRSINMIQNRLLIHLSTIPRLSLRCTVASPAAFLTLARLNQAKTLTAAAFALPREPSEKQIQASREQIRASKEQARARNQQDQALQQSEPFEMTQLVRGQTPLKIGITDAAKDKLREIAKNDDGLANDRFALRVKVESGGCHGFQYNFELTTLDKELGQDAELAVFQRKDMELARLIFDESSLEILQDSKLDYTTELIGSSFKMVDSPYTSTSCGCGASFDFDFEKLERAKAPGSDPS